MPGFFLHVGAVMQCPHLAPATVPPLQPRVLVMGQPVAPFTSIIGVIGCLFQIPIGTGTKPQPCVTVKWAMPSVRVLVLGQPAALAPGPGPGPALCLSVEQIPAGPPTISAVQVRVLAS